MEHRLGLDIGCGNRKAKGLLGLDFIRTPGVDLVADARMLPFKDDSFNVVYSSHVIEHFGHRELGAVLTEWVRVLKREGMLEIRCPDLRARAFLYSLNPSWQNMKNIYGRQDHSGNYHKSGLTYGLLKHYLSCLGICNMKRVISGYKGIPFIPNSLDVRGWKK